MKILPLFFFSFLIGICGISAQENFAKDVAFFQKKTRLYQHWLEKKDLGKYLEVDTILVKENGALLELWLGLRTHDPDSAASIWPALQRSFQKNNGERSLGQTLFGTFIRMMEIPPDQANIQIYIPLEDQSGYNPCFYVWLWEEEGIPQSDENINNCKSMPFEVNVDIPIIQQTSNQTLLAVYKKEDIHSIFKSIGVFAKQMFEVEKKNENQTPKLDTVIMTNTMLTFSVSGLRREVLKDEEKSWWCTWVEYWTESPCNDMKRERLEFIFRFMPNDTGYSLSGELTGKFGSGIYEPRSEHYMDMEPDFEEYLKKYMKKFQYDLQLFLDKSKKINKSKDNTQRG